MANIDQLIRQDLKDIEPYPIDRQGNQNGIWLDMNELPWDPCEQMTIQGINRYPLPNPPTLMSQLANFYGIASSNLVLTRGSDDGIDALIRLFCQPFQDEIIISSPTFSMYSISAKLHGVKVVDVPLKENFSWCKTDIKKNMNAKTKIIFICTPNNPTGNTIEPDEILALAEEVSNQAIVVVDEAYIEFSNTVSMATQIERVSNLVVLRTLSKAFGLAGIRCGVAMAQAKLINFLQALLPPFPLSQLTLNAATLATTWENIERIKGYVTIVQTQRKLLQEKLASFSFVKKVWPSQANFVLIQCEDAEQVYWYCAEQGFILRRFSKQSTLQDCLRISVGLPLQNEKLLNALALLKTNKGIGL